MMSDKETPFEPLPETEEALPEQHKEFVFQAERVLMKFGGARRLCSILKTLGDSPKNPATIYRWTYPKSKGGTGGLIPSHALPKVLEAARLQGIVLSSEDIDPRPSPVKKLTLPKCMR